MALKKDIRGGNPQFYTPQCGSVGPTGKCVSTSRSKLNLILVKMPPSAILQYDDNVPGNGSNYNDAYFEIKYVRAYTSGVVPPSGSGASSTGTKTGTAPSPTGNSGSSAGSKSGFVSPLVGTIIVSLAGLAVIFIF
jgi:hypothetical protein